LPAHKKPEDEKSETQCLYIKKTLLDWLKSISPNKGDMSRHVNAALEMYRNSFSNN